MNCWGGGLNIVKICISIKLHNKEFSAPTERLRSKMNYIYVLTLKLQLFSSNSVTFDLTGPYDKRTARPLRDQLSEELMSLLFKFLTDVFED